jgi:lipoprotein-anchoring transpeptidase ErfK/SrfK
VVDAENAVDDIYHSLQNLIVLARIKNAAIPVGSQPDERVQSTSMQRLVLAALIASALGSVAAFAEPLPLNPRHHADRNGRLMPSFTQAFAAPQAAQERAPEQRYASVNPPHLGGGLIEFLFGGGIVQPFQAHRYQPDPAGSANDPRYQRYTPSGYRDAARPDMDPRYQRQVVDYDGREGAGTIVIDTPTRYLYLVQGGGKAIRYGIGVGRPGFTWAGVKQITNKREWPDWRPPPEMLRRRPDLPTWMAGGPENPLGARAMYLGSSLYRIHGSNEPWTIGTAVSSGCIRMRNEDVIDLYGRVKVGTRVVVI